MVTILLSSVFMCMLFSQNKCVGVLVIISVCCEMRSFMFCVVSVKFNVDYIILLWCAVT